MSDGRALLTDREREALETDESGSYRYKTRSYIRNRIERLEADAELLADAEPELFEELREAVCDVDTDGDVQPPADSRESGVTPSTPDPDPTDGQSGSPARGGSEPAAAGDIPRDVLEGDSFTEPIPGDLEDDELLAAIGAAFEELKANTPLSKGEIIRAVMPSHPLKYDPDAALEKLDAGEGYRGKWWRLIRDGLKGIDDVDPSSGGNDKWRYTGDDEWVFAGGGE